MCGAKVSEPYINMTLSLMTKFGVEFEKNDDTIIVHPQQYKVKDIAVEVDWSSAVFFYQMGALADTNLQLKLKGLKKASVQGDKIIADLMHYFGVETIFEEGGVLLTKGKEHIPKLRFNFSSYPDLVPSLLVTCASMNVKAELWGIEHLRIKETDRINALRNELGKMGVSFYEQEDVFICEGKIHHPNALITTYNDHRIAMSFAPLAMLFGEIDIENTDVVGKSFPEYWKQLLELGFEIK